MKKSFILSTIIFASLYFFVACQATPDEKIVLEKDSDVLIEKAQDENTPQNSSTLQNISLKERYSIPDSYQYQADSTKGHLHLNIDARVTVPEAQELPIQRVQLRTFTQKEVDVLIETLMKGAEIYTAPDPTSGQLVNTKAQLEKMLIKTQQDLALNNFNGMTQEDLEKRIAELKKDIAKAPESLEDIALERSDGKLVHDDKLMGYPCEYIDINAELGGSRFANLKVINDIDNGIVSANFQNGFWEDDSSMELTISENEAQEIAERLINELGIDMILEKIESGESTSIVRPPDSPVYTLTYIRAANEIPIFSIEGSGGNTENYIYRWQNEKMVVVIDNNGIAGLQWDSPCSVESLVVEDSNLLSFDEITERIESTFFTVYNEQAIYDGKDTNNSDEIFDINYNISDLILGLSRIAEKNSPQTGLIVPTWFLCAEMESYSSGTQNATSSAYTLPHDVHLMINAVDGSLIE